MIAGGVSSAVDRLGRRVCGVGKHLRTFQNFPLTVAVNLGVTPKAGDHELRLRNGLRLVMDATYLSATTNAIKDVVVDDTYGLCRLDRAQPATIVDIGAHVGSFSLVAALRCPTATVYAVEPSPRNFEYLSRNIERNGLSDRIQARQVAVAGTAGAIEMYSSRQSATRNSIYESEFFNTQHGETVTVEAISLESLFEHHGITRCDFLKLDCEGAEYEVLFRAPAEILQRVQVVGMEFHEGVAEGSGAELEAFFVKQGFVVRREAVPDCPRLGMLLAERVAS